MRLASHARRNVGRILVALFTLSLAACAPPPSSSDPPQARPIIDGDGG